MNNIKLIKKGAAYLSSGEITPILNFICDKFKNSGNRFEIRSTDDRSNNDFNLLRVESEGQYKYYRVSGGNQLEQSFENVSYIQFNIIDLREVNACKVNFVAHTEEGNTIQRTFKYDNSAISERDYIPIKYSLDDSPDIKKIDLLLEHSEDNTSDKMGSTTDLDWKRKEPKPILSHPIAQKKNEKPNVLLVTIDTFRHDYLNKLRKTINELGENVQIPTYPQTQGVCTWASHASMFTGTHPGRHKSQAKEKSLYDSSLTTLPQILKKEGYTCSACTGSNNVTAQGQLAGDFHRYEVMPMDWKKRKYDAKSNVGRIIDWMDLDHNCSGNFYFLHLFDAHYPYYPPLSTPDMGGIDYNLKDRIPHPGDDRDYMDIVRNDPIEVRENDLSIMKDYYSKALEYIDHNLSNLISYMNNNNILEDTLVIIAGDHGEEFYENNFLYHHSLREANIRSGMIVKPPIGSDLLVPDNANTIDILPSVANMLDREPPKQCAGQSWKRSYKPEFQITERFIYYYNISVKKGMKKGIFTFDKNGHNRPTEEQLQTGPILQEYFSVENGEKSINSSISSSEKQVLRQKAYEFIRSGRNNTRYEKADLSRSAKKRLEKLGYK